MLGQIPRFLSKAIGLSCCQARVGYAGTLRIGIGNKVYYNTPRLEGKFHGEWDFSSYSSAWRILQGSKLLCGSYDSHEHADRLLSVLVGEVLIEIVQPSSHDITLVFSNELQVNLFGQAEFTNILEILAPQDFYFEFVNGEWSESDSAEPAEGLSIEEQKINHYSEQCHERWSQLVPRAQSDDQCKECAFFRAISGQFYFWDYGLCSNGASDYDGKVVGIDSGCIHFNDTFPLVEE